jgi:cysteine-rich repeat protein
MNVCLHLVMACGATALVACSIDAVVFTPHTEPPDSALLTEDCTAMGDEDGNQLADCADPACAGTASCQPRCGNGTLEAGEACDDGNLISGDGCESNCIPTPYVVPAGPALWLRFEDPPDDGVLDSARNHPVTCQSCGPRVPGAFGNAYLLDATSQIVAQPAPDLEPNTAFTVAAWVRIDARPTTGLALIGCKAIDPFSCAYAMLVSPTGSAVFRSAGAPDISSPPLTTGTWHHLAMTWDGQMRVGYVDGGPVAPFSYGLIPIVVMPLFVGGRAVVGTEALIGLIDEFVFYNRVLSGSELAQLAKK